MKLQDLLCEYNDIMSGDFADLSKFNFYGVYIICDTNNDIVYIGSAYARTIEQRLKQYRSQTDTGNTLGKSIAKSLANKTKFDDESKEHMNEAVELIKTFKIYAIKYHDLEYKLIDLAKPKYNNCGKDVD